MDHPVQQKHTQILLRRGYLRIEQRIDQTKQLHDSFILPQIFMSLQQEHIIAAIRAFDGQLSGPLFTGDNIQLWFNLGDANKLLFWVVRSRNGQLEIGTFGQFGRNVLQLERGQLGQLTADSSKDVIVNVPGLVQILRVLG